MRNSIKLKSSLLAMTAVMAAIGFVSNLAGVITSYMDD